MITTEEGDVLSRRINANRFIESSARKDINVKETIHEAVRAAVNGALLQKNEETEAEDDCSWCCCRQ